MHVARQKREYELQQMQGQKREQGCTHKRRQEARQRPAHMSGHMFGQERMAPRGTEPRGWASQAVETQSTSNNRWCGRRCNRWTHR